MPRILCAATWVGLVLAVTAAQADDQPGNRKKDSQPAADASSAGSSVEGASGKARKDWVHALAGKLESARSALKGHQLVVTSENAETRTFTYEDAAKTVETAEARLVDLAAADATSHRVELSLPKQPNRDGDLKVEVTGGVDTVGVLLSKKM